MIGDRLKKARLDCGLTQQQVADLLGIDRSSYTYYETGKSKVTTQTLRLLSVVYGVDFNSLLYEKPQALVFHSSTKYKPSSYDDNPYVSNVLSADERRMLAQLRLIKFMGKESELEDILNRLSAPETAVISDSEVGEDE